MGAFAVIAATGASMLLACQWVVGIHDYDESGETADAGRSLAGLDATTSDGAAAPPPAPNPDAGDAAIVVTDRCLHTTYPAELADASVSSDPTLHVFSATAISFVPKGTSGYLGRDIDGVCTGFSGQTYLNGISSCATSNDVNDQPQTGVDNSLAVTLNSFNALLAALDGSVDTLSNVNDRIVSGAQTFVFVVTNWDGSPNANTVFVTAYLTGPLESNLCDGGVDRDGGTNVTNPGNGTSFQPTPRDDGCDTWSVGLQNFYPQSPGLPYQPIATTSDAWIVDGTLVAIYGAGLDLPFGLATIHTRETSIQAQLLPSANGPSPTSLAVGDGFIAGRLTPTDMFTAFAGVSDPAQMDHGLCPGSPSFPDSQTNICNARDISASKSEDFTGHGCDAISFASSFSAVPAKLDSNPIDAGVSQAAPGCEGVPIAECGDAGF